MAGRREEGHDNKYLECCSVSMAKIIFSSIFLTADCLFQKNLMLLIFYYKSLSVIVICSETDEC